MKVLYSSTLLITLLLSEQASASMVRGVATTMQQHSHRALTGAVTTLELIDATSNVKVLDLMDGTVIDVGLLNLDEHSLNIRALTDGEVSSVRFGLNDQPVFRTESAAPFAMCGDDGEGDYYNCQSLGLGTFTVTATPLETLNGLPTGVTGAPVVMTFEIVNNNNSATCATTWTDFVVMDHTEGADQGQVECGAPHAFVTGVQCVGDYCDDIRVQCEQCDSCTYPDTAFYWTAPFSDETSEPTLCDDDHFMTGLSCEGHYCDNLTMQCTRNTGRTAGECSWSEWVSEEEGGTIEFSGVTFVELSAAATTAITSAF